MSTGAVRKAITEVIEELIEDACLDLESTRICYNYEDIWKRTAREGMELEVMEVFDEFCATLYSKLEALCEASKTVKSHSTMRGRLWAAFHKVAMCDLPGIT